MEELKHHSENLSGGGFVFVLNTGAAIDPQAEAMLQALHSRSTGGIRAHLEVLKKKGAEKFMETFYVGYGHKSIGDCGSATVFVEGVSMLAAKAIQDWRLYSGQEASTRYIDFSEQPFINPLGSDAGKQVLEDWRSFYLKSQEPVRAYLRHQFPRQEHELEQTYEKAIAARAFDITRGLLPAGAATNVAWRMNLRQFADAIMYLRHHPLAEVREIAEKTEIALRAAFPQSFGHTRYDATEAYNKEAMLHYYYRKDDCSDFMIVRDGVDRDMLKEYCPLLSTRPPKTELPPPVAECGTITYAFLLDFGSFRDIQRHRSVIQRMPLLTHHHGFEPWYISSFPENMRETVTAFLQKQKIAVQALAASPEMSQYYIAMGYNVPCRLTGDLRALVYVGELRATRFVHPTLVHRATQLLDDLETRFNAEGLVIHRDSEPNRFDVRRGEHDIVMKED